MIICIQISVLYTCTSKKKLKHIRYEKISSTSKKIVAALYYVPNVPMYVTMYTYICIIRNGSKFKRQFPPISFKLRSNQHKSFNVIFDLILPIPILVYSLFYQGIFYKSRLSWWYMDIEQSVSLVKTNKH